MGHKISLPELIHCLRLLSPDQGEEDFARWLRQGEAVRVVYFTWLPHATVGVDLVKPEVWLYSTEPVEKIGHFLALVCAVKDRFMRDLPNVPHEHSEGHGKPPYYTLDETVGGKGREC